MHPHHIEEALFGRVGTDDCHKVGIMGGCGVDCFVYLEGRCTEPDEMIERLQTQEDKEIHEQLYGKKVEVHQIDNKESLTNNAK